jgi:hypothetical protein
MSKNLLLFILLSFAVCDVCTSQQERYSVSIAPFSSVKYNEFSPVFYRNGIVYITDKKAGSFTDYSNSQGQSTFKIYIANSGSKSDSFSAKLFSKSLTTRFNDGPVTFNSKGDTIYYSRNILVDGKIKDLTSSRNKLGLFTAVLIGSKWTRIREMRFNNERYNISTPSLSHDGKRIYFASDKPDGFGGTDLYYSELKDDYWSDPVNLGPEINTAGNESYPFITPAGDLFFSSDGHPGGLGGKDIYYSKMKDNKWLTPVLLDPPVNSGADDFGFIIDSGMSHGYFSSNRNKSLDIYFFKINFPQIFYAEAQKENQFCFSFSDSGSIAVDTADIRYVWDFGNGNKVTGSKINHCFPGPGKYNVRLDLVDKSTGLPFFSKLSYTLNLKEYEQPYIYSDDAVVTGDSVVFDGLNSRFSGYEVLDYSWDFGDSTRLQGCTVKHSFKRSGEYKVSLGVKLKSHSTGIFKTAAVIKKVVVYNTPEERTAFQVSYSNRKLVIPYIRSYENAIIDAEYSAEVELRKDAVAFQVVLLTSKDRIGTNSSVFRNVPVKYTIRELADTSGGYVYIADQQMTLMATYPAYKDILASGFKDATVTVASHTDPADKELYSLKKNFGLQIDQYFDGFGRLTSNSYIMLDQVVKILNKYPGIKLEVDAFSDINGNPENDLASSLNQAQLLVNYLINRGIQSKRLIARGYGRSRPISTGRSEQARRINRRIDLVIVSR